MTEPEIAHAEVEALIAEFWQQDERLPFLSLKDVYRVAAHRFYRLAQRGETVSRSAHNSEIAGSTPAAATNFQKV